MRTLVVLLFSALLFAGCASSPSSSGYSPGLLTKILDGRLNPHFIGDAKIETSYPPFSVRIEAGNLHRGPDGWEYDWLVWERHGFSSGKLVLGTPPARPL